MPGNQELKKKEIVDIMIFIYNLKKGKEDAAIKLITKRKVLGHIILLEIKTTDKSATRHDQLWKQIKNTKTLLNSLKKKEDLIIDIPDDAINNMSMIYITPNGNETDSCLTELRSSEFDEHPISHIFWSEADLIKDLESNQVWQGDSEEKLYSLLIILLLHLPYPFSDYK